MRSAYRGHNNRDLNCLQKLDLKRESMQATQSPPNMKGTPRTVNIYFRHKHRQIFVKQMAHTNKRLKLTAFQFDLLSREDSEIAWHDIQGITWYSRVWYGMVYNATCLVLHCTAYVKQLVPISAYQLDLQELQAVILVDVFKEAVP